MPGAGLLSVAGSAAKAALQHGSPSSLRPALQSTSIRQPLILGTTTLLCSVDLTAASVELHDARASYPAVFARGWLVSALAPGAARRVSRSAQAPAAAPLSLLLLLPETHLKDPQLSSSALPCASLDFSNPSPSAAASGAAFPPLLDAGLHLAAARLDSDAQLRVPASVELWADAQGAATGQPPDARARLQATASGRALEVSANVSVGTSKLRVASLLLKPLARLQAAGALPAAVPAELRTENSFETSIRAAALPAKYVDVYPALAPVGLSAIRTTVPSGSLRVLASADSHLTFSRSDSLIASSAALLSLLRDEKLTSGPLQLQGASAVPADACAGRPPWCAALAGASKLLGVATSENVLGESVTERLTCAYNARTGNAFANSLAETEALAVEFGGASFGHRLVPVASGGSEATSRPAQLRNGARV